MKLHVTFVLGALVATASQAYAGECTNAQLESFETSSNDTASITACPALFGDDTSFMNLARTETFTNETIAAISPCKAPACTTYLTQLTEKVPDCTVLGISVKSIYGAVLTVCKKFATGTVDQKEVAEIFEGVLANASSPLAGIFGNITEDNANTSMPSKESTPAASSAASVQTPGPAKSAAPYLTGLAAVATAGVATTFQI